MQSFLNKVAQSAINQFPKTLGDLTIVLPNRRAIVFLKEEFRKELKNGGWLPRFFSLEDFVFELGSYRLADQTELMFDLYYIHQQIEGKNAESFHEFMSWGATLLHDFNEIDRYLVDSRELYTFLTEAKALEIWNLDGEGLTEFQHKYLRFWQQLGLYYNEFKKHLIKERKFYQGLAFRSVAEQLSNKTIQPEGFEQLIFAGFNALTEAEKKIIAHFQQKGAIQLWDADSYYLEDAFQEAGTFIRAYKAASNNTFNWISDDLLTGKKTVTIYGISGNVGQAKLIGNLIDQKAQQNQAVVLADEELLVPVLESLPEKVETTNVTMGYSLSLSPLFSWLENFLKLFNNNHTEGSIEAYYHNDLKQFLQHSISEHFSKAYKIGVQKWLQLIEQKKSIYISRSELSIVDELLDATIFNRATISPSLLIDNALLLINKLRESAQESLDLLTKECLHELEKTFMRLDRLCKEHHENIDIESLIELYKQLVSKQTVSFIGEPLGGLQVMGVLESRTLDFENIIISSVNEGILPSGKTQNSFIPFDIKRKFNLPSYQEKDAIFAYHFYRILQRAKNISIIYNTKVNQLQGGERSRFIEQLIHELPRKNSNVTLHVRTISESGKIIKTPPIQITKSNRIKEIIKAHLKRGLSPSALNTFIACPLDYYYRYVLKLREQSSLEEKIEDNTLGTLVHNSLEELYKPFLNTPLNLTIIQQIYAKVDQELNRQFDLLLNVKAEFGNHKLTYEVAKVFIEGLINHDRNALKKGATIEILELEGELKYETQIELDDHSIVPICLYGKIDRIDRFNDKKRIIDYKTGSTNPSDLNYSNPQTLLNGLKSKAIQLLIYQYGFSTTNKEPVTAAIVSLRNISQGAMPLKSKSIKDDTEFLLKNVISNLLSDEPFEHKDSSSYCKFCKTKKGL